MSLSPMRPVSYSYAAPQVQPQAPAPAQPPVVQVPVGTVRNDVLGNTLTGTKDFVSAAMTGQPLPGASPLKQKALGLIKSGQSAFSSLVAKFRPQQPMGVQAVQPPQTLLEKAKQVGKAAIFFALPVGGAAAVAAGLGWAIGPLVPLVGGHVFGAVAGALLIGQTSGFLLHGAMRLSLITDPSQREINSAGATVGSAAIGAGLAAAIGLAAGAPLTLPLVLGGAALGAAPRLVEWVLARL